MSLKTPDLETHNRIKTAQQQIEQEYREKYDEEPPTTQKQINQISENTNNSQTPEEALEEINTFYHELLDTEKPQNVKIKTKRKPYREISTGALTTFLALQVTELEPAIATGILTGLAAHAIYRDQEPKPNYNPITKNFSITDNQDAQTYEHIAAEQYHAFQQHNNSPTFGDPILQEGTEMLARTYSLRNKAFQEPEFEKYVDAVGHGIYKSAREAIRKIEDGEKPSDQAIKYHLPATIIDQDDSGIREVFHNGREALDTDLEPYEQHLDYFWNFKMNHVYSKL